jgi:molybdopterin-guanine dinucleotide biosynthesis protein A
VQRIIREVSFSGAEGIIIVANDARPYEGYGCEIIPDLRPGNGPLGGIESGLKYYLGRSEGVLFLPCDLPKIGRQQIQVLESAFRSECTRVVFAKTKSFFVEPLCSIVQNDILDAVSRSIDAGRRKVLDLWQELGGMAVCFDDARPFFNVNTPQDIKRWRRCMSLRAELQVPADLLKPLRSFIEKASIPLELDTDEAGSAVRVTGGDENQKSDGCTLRVGGWIACETARAMAENLQISTHDMGKLLNHLKVKIRECGLGCFE